MFYFGKSTKLVLITVVIIILLFFLHQVGILSPLERAFVAITKPVMRITYNLSNRVGENYLELKSKQELIQENKELKDQLDTLVKEKSKYTTEREENEFLRAQLKFVQEADHEFMIANVIGKNVDNIQNSLVLDKGSKDGVLVGQPVLADEGIMIGKISKVTSNNSFVLLINDDLSFVAAKIKSKTKTMGVVDGEFGLGIKMRLIPQNEIINEGDVVVTSGLEKYVPADLIIGLVELVFNEPEELFQEVSIKSQVDFNKITLVNIIKVRNVD